MHTLVFLGASAWIGVLLEECLGGKMESEARLDTVYHIPLATPTPYSCTCTSIATYLVSHPFSMMAVHR